jgi:hypothetical protein
LYIAGWGRSGSTIVDNILGSYASVVSVGELYFLWRRGLGQGRHCGCGRPLPRCPFWGEVLDLAYRDDVLRAAETHDRQQRSVRIRHTRRLAHRALDPDAARYRDELGRVYAAITAVSGADLIVDSSKVPAGAAIAARIDGVDAYLLQMIRDPRAVAYSWMRPKLQPDRKVPTTMVRHTAVDSGLSWVAWNLLIEDVARTGYRGRHLRLRYEDFIDDPQAAIEAVLALVGLPPAGTPFRAPFTVHLDGNHTVSGNPSRFSIGDVPLTPDNAWHREQSRRDRLVSTATSLPLLRRYGYRIRPRPPRERSGCPRTMAG